MSALLGLVLPALLLGAAPPASPRFVPGEILVKFVPGSDGGAAVAQTGRATPPDLASLTPVVDRLAATAGVSLKAKQVTGGGWVVLAVVADELVEELVETLGRRASVAGIGMRADAPGVPGATTAPKAVVVAFAEGSEEYAAAAAKRAGTDSGRFSRLIRALEGDVGVPLKGEVTREDNVVVEIDLHALTEILVERLKALPEIESVQPNYILTIR